MFEQPCQRGYLPLNAEKLTIENNPVTISGDPSKPPNDNRKTKLKNNSTPTTQEACGRASITSHVLKGIKTATVNIAASQHCLHREHSRGCCRRDECILHFRRGCNPILPTGEYPPGRGLWACAFQLILLTSSTISSLCLWFPHA